MELTALITLALLIEYFIFMMLVGAARGKTGIQAPATTGDPFFEATLRVQQNTLEQLIYVIPSLWICSYFLNELLAVSLGTVFLRAYHFLCGLSHRAGKARHRLYDWLVGFNCINSQRLLGGN